MESSAPGGCPQRSECTWVFHHLYLPLGPPSGPGSMASGSAARHKEESSHPAPAGRILVSNIRQKTSMLRNQDGRPGGNKVRGGES